MKTLFTFIAVTAICFTPLVAQKAQYACYDVYPSTAGTGDCVIRTSIESDNGSSDLDFKACIGK